MICFARRLKRAGIAVGLVAAGACSDAPVDSTGDGGKHSASARDAGSSNSDAGDFADNPTMPIGFRVSGSTGSAVREAQQVVWSDVFYSWTTDEELDELRANPVLLTRSEANDGAHTTLSAAVGALGDQGVALAEVLTGGAFEKGRYAWTNAWAMRQGWPGESYGNRLLRIVLKPEAWIVLLYQNQFSVTDMSGNSIELGAALGSPERIAAVYYVNSGEGDLDLCGPPQRDGCATGTYREYFINNEKMVKEWSFDTKEILDELHDSIDFVEIMRDQTEPGPSPTMASCDFTRDAFCTWYRQFAGNKPGDEYLFGLALTNEYYRRTTSNLDDLHDALKDSLFEPDPFVHEP
jgi:hypothetical protein